MIPPGIHGPCTCSSSALRAMLANSGDRMPPCGVPVKLASRMPSSVITPALRNAFTARARACP
jgi:hypothetical protein